MRCAFAVSKESEGMKVLNKLKVGTVAEIARGKSHPIVALEVEHGPVHKLVGTLVVGDSHAGDAAELHVLQNLLIGLVHVGVPSLVAQVDLEGAQRHGALAVGAGDVVVGIAEVVEVDFAVLEAAGDEAKAETAEVVHARNRAPVAAAEAHDGVAELALHPYAQVNDVDVPEGAREEHQGAAAVRGGCQMRAGAAEVGDAIGHVVGVHTA
ncbi:helicase domain-containing protein [Babesia caballi]|uniref:Helicase domain-containing protein n=1 Tax=Babesia caballi TaxID=5871 RepID=A0AAV4LNG6_BABCB|nr:helicase domain-containing protein [Babesia caballi]